MLLIAEPSDISDQLPDRVIDDVYELEHFSPVADAAYVLADGSWGIWEEWLLESRGGLRRFHEEPIFEWIHRAQTVAQMAGYLRAQVPTYVGRLRPRVVFVGERPNPRGERLMLTFMPHPSGCGDYLMEALRHVARTQPQIGLMNAYVDAEPQEFETLRVLGAHFVALGRAAHAALVQAGIRPSTVDHPQYVKRFHYADQDYYSALLHTAAHVHEFRGQIR